MSNEDPNNSFHWKNKLDELEHLPGSAFNGNAAWDELHGRLLGNKKNKKIYWYWIAAACLVLVVMITLLNYQESTSKPGDKETVIKEKPKEIKKPVLKVEETNTNEMHNGPASVIVSTSNKPVQRKQHIIQTEVATKVHSDDAVVNYPEQEPIAKSLQIVNNNPTTAMIPSKKKLNVVHINELGDPVIETPDMAGKIGKHSFKLGNQEVYANPSVYKNTDFTILKTKL
jgi:hypothetical protein